MPGLCSPLHLRAVELFGMADASYTVELRLCSQCTPESHRPAIDVSTLEHRCIRCIRCRDTLAGNPLSRIQVVSWTPRDGASIAPEILLPCAIRDRVLDVRISIPLGQLSKCLGEPAVLHIRLLGLDPEG